MSVWAPLKQDTSPIRSMHQLQQTYRWFQGRKEPKSTLGHCNRLILSMVVTVDHPNKSVTHLWQAIQQAWHHGTIAILRYSPSRRSILLSWINSRFRSHGGICSSRYHAKGPRCVTNSLTYSKCHSIPESTDVRLFLFRAYLSLANNFFLLVGHSRAGSPWIANDL